MRKECTKTQRKRRSRPVGLLRQIIYMDNNWFVAVENSRNIGLIGYYLYESERCEGSIKEAASALYTAPHT